MFAAQLLVQEAQQRSLLSNFSVSLLWYLKNNNFSVYESDAIEFIVHDARTTLKELINSLFGDT